MRQTVAGQLSTKAERATGRGFLDFLKLRNAPSLDAWYFILR